MNVYYKIIGHLEDQEQEVGTFIFDDEQPTNYIEKMFSQNLLLNSGYDSNDIKNKEDECYPEIYIDFIFKSYQPIAEQN
jgi:hypothetical protein